MGKAIIPRSVAWAIKQDYEKRDEKGRRLYTMMELAAKYLVSETTVYRAVKNYGAYGTQPLPEVKGDQELSALAAESLQRLVQQGIPITDESGRELSVQEKMSLTAKATAERNRRGDKLIEELKGEPDGRDQATGTGGGQASSPRAK